MSGAELIMQEREEQINKHNISVCEDFTCNDNGELIQGAIAILEGNSFPDTWDWERCQHMREKDWIGKLVIAGALIAAEIDRLNYNRS